MLKFIAIILIGIGLSFGFFALAQEEPLAEIDITQEINLDENIEAQDLGVKEPRILPGSPFYFLKDFGRGIRSFFTFNPVKKAELRLRFANEKLIEAKKLAVRRPQALPQALKNYRAETERLKK
jgi:hypothetical protein